MINHTKLVITRFTNPFSQPCRECLLPSGIENVTKRKSRRKIWWQSKFSMSNVSFLPNILIPQMYLSWSDAVMEIGYGDYGHFEMSVLNIWFTICWCWCCKAFRRSLDLFKADWLKGIQSSCTGGLSLAAISACTLLMNSLTASTS